MSKTKRESQIYDDRSHRLASANNLLTLTVDFLVESLLEGIVGDERRARTAVLYWELATWCDEKGDHYANKRGRSK